MNIIQISIQASVLIIAIVMIRSLTLHKLPKKTFLVLWGIVLCRLLVPFSIPFRYSLYSGLDKLINMFTGRADSPSPVRITVTPHMRNIHGVGKIIGFDASAATTIPLIVMIWVAGICACAFFFIVAYIRCRSEFRLSLPVENDFTTRWLREHSLRRAVQICQNDRIKTPLTYGVFHPVIIFPKQTDWTDETKLQYVLAHEFTHIRRFDTLTKIVLTAAVCVHWFNPFVWVMYVLANRDIELSCDETVVRIYGDAIKAAYALTLISMEEKKRYFIPLTNNFCKYAIEERIVSIMKIKKSSLAAIIISLILVIGTATVFVTSAVDYTSKREASSNERLDHCWTYDQYRNWFNMEKDELWNVIGQKIYSKKDGWFVFTQAEYKRTIRSYELVLEDIKNGTKYSTILDGTEDVSMEINLEDKELGTSAKVYLQDLTLKNAEKDTFGHPTKKALLAVVEPLYKYAAKEDGVAAVKSYCEEQAKTGNMSLQEANEMINR